MSSLSTTAQRYGHQPGASPRSILLATTIFLSGGFAGLFFSTVLFFGQVHKDLASMHRNLEKAEKTIAQLTGKSSTTKRTNSLLAELKRQEATLKEARTAIVSLQALDREVKRQTAEIDYARRELEQVALLLDDLQLTGDRLEDAFASVSGFSRLQSELATQDSQLLYSLDAVDRVKDINQRLLSLAAEEDSLHNALTGFDVLGQRIQSVGVRAEEFAYTLDGVENFVERHNDLGAQLPGLEWDVESMQGIVRSVAGQRAEIEQAREVARDMSSVVDSINRQDVAIDNAVDTLAQLDGLEGDVHEVTRNVESMVEAFHLISGMNQAISNALATGEQLKRGLVEFTLLKPAMEQVVSDWNRLQTGIYAQAAQADKIETATQIIGQQSRLADESAGSDDEEARR